MKTNALAGLLTVMLAMGCDGDDNPGTVTGNGVTVQSLAYADPSRPIPAAEEDFRLCTTKLQLEGDGSPGFEQRLGLVDLSDPDATQVWGELEVEEELSVDKIVVQLAVDAESCDGVGFSFSYRGTEITRDVEFVFQLDAPVTVAPDDTLSLGVSAIAGALEDALAAGELNDADIGAYVERFSDTARLEP